MEPLELGEAWTRVLDDLKQDNAISTSVLAFIKNAAPLTITEGTLLLVTPDELSKRIVEQRLRDQVLRLMSHYLELELTRLAVTIDSAGAAALAVPDEPVPAESPEPVRLEAVPPLAPDPEESEHDPRHVRHNEATPLPAPAVPLKARPRQQTRQGEPADAPRLNPKYTFDTFVTGSSNRFASAAASAVAEAPAQAYNPLFVYGDSGLGKTHLLHAIGHYAMSLYEGKRVRFVNSEEFTNDFINSIGEGGGTAEFHRRYRDVDILLIDDIQFLSNKEQTQEEFFHTFNTLHNANKQIVITSDVAPKLLSGFEARMRSRFESGLITDIQPPDLETRIAILRKKAAAEGMDVPHDVLEYIASRIATNIRELEGALIRVTAFANLNAQPATVNLAEIVLKDVISKDDREVTPAAIIAHTCAYFGLTVDDLTGPSRTRSLTTARQIAMYLCREMTPLSLPKIGAHFGGRDHTTVIHAEKKIRTLMAQKHAIYNQVTELTNRIRQNHPI